MIVRRTTVIQLLHYQVSAEEHKRMRSCVGGTTQSYRYRLRHNSINVNLHCMQCLSNNWLISVYVLCLLFRHAPAVTVADCNTIYFKNTTNFVLNFIELDNLKFVERLKLNSSILKRMLPYHDFRCPGTDSQPTPYPPPPVSQDRNEYDSIPSLCVPRQRDERKLNADRMNDTTLSCRLKERSRLLRVTYQNTTESRPKS
jgi:hypothetical protein